MSDGYRTPESRRASVRAVLEALEGARRVILTTHVHADGDGVGCQAALLALLADGGREGWIVNPTPFPDPYRFLLEDEGRVLDARGEDARTQAGQADLCVVVDTGEKSRIGRVKPLVDHLPLVVVDHHPEGDDPLEGVSLRDPGAAAAGELIYDVLLEHGGPWTRQVVDGLYVSLMTDTGAFRYSNTTPGVHRIAADLISRGADPEVLYRRAYEDAPLRRYRLLAEALATLESSDAGHVAWMTVPTEPYRELGCGSDDLEGFVDFPRSLEGVEVALLFREIEDGARVKISLRSTGRVDVNVLARSMGGGGHVRAAGAVVPGPMPEARSRVVERTVAHVRETLDGEGSGNRGRRKA